MERSDMTTTLANQLPRINLANGGSMQSAQVVTLKSGQQNPSSVDSKSPMHSLENRPLHLHSRSKVCGCDCDLVAELAKRLRQPPGVSHLGLGIRFDAVLYKPHPLMQDLPHHAAESMGDGPDGGLITQARQQAPEHHLKVTAFPLDRSVRRLVQHPPQIFIAFGGATAGVRFGTFIFPGTGSH